jgi:hypothetical protein
VASEPDASIAADDAYMPEWAAEEPQRDDTLAPAQASPSSNDQPGFGEPVESFLALLHTHGPALFKIWAIELREQPERLPDILGELTIDGWILNQAAEPHAQEALAQALAAAPERLASVAARPAAETVRAQARPAENDPDLPDWMRLRQSWGEDGGEA